MPFEGDARLHVAGNYIQSLNCHTTLFYNMQEDALLRCIYDSMSILGDNTRASILAKLQHEGVGFTPDTFDIDRFSTAVEDLLGYSAEFVFLKILDEFGNKLSLSKEQLRTSERAYHRMSHAGLLRVLFAIAK
jgi:hypothetical protein